MLQQKEFLFLYINRSSSPLGLYISFVLSVSTLSKSSCNKYFSHPMQYLSFVISAIIITFVYSIFFPHLLKFSIASQHYDIVLARIRSIPFLTNQQTITILQDPFTYPVTIPQACFKRFYYERGNCFTKFKKKLIPPYEFGFLSYY